MIVITKVYDKRCDKGWGLRRTEVGTKEDAINWVKTRKNLLSPHCTIIDKGRAEFITF